MTPVSLLYRTEAYFSLANCSASYLTPTFGLVIVVPYIVFDSVSFSLICHALDVESDAFLLFPLCQLTKSNKQVYDTNSSSCIHTLVIVSHGQQISTGFPIVFLKR